jgi:hypothetical protein
MTSYEWKPGNYNGAYHAPKYSALSYTWGRYKLKGDPKSDVGAIMIKGIDWDIPRIDPKHFCTFYFELAIHATRDYADFIWLDVACIDQTSYSAEGRLEVGRQAAIFKGAAMTFIWLSTQMEETLSECVKKLNQDSEC